VKYKFFLLACHQAAKIFSKKADIYHKCLLYVQSQVSTRAKIEGFCYISARNAYFKLLGAINGRQSLFN
jgi:hypothetical protein